MVMMSISISSLLGARRSCKSLTWYHRFRITSFLNFPNDRGYFSANPSPSAANLRCVCVDFIGNDLVSNEYDY